MAGGGGGGERDWAGRLLQARPLSWPAGGCECREGREVNLRRGPGKSGGELLPLCSVFLFFFLRFIFMPGCGGGGARL